MSAVASIAVLHSKDEDCTLDGDEQCVACGVSHTATCSKCGGRGFHRATCPDNDEGPYLASTLPAPPDAAMLRHAEQFEALASFLDGRSYDVAGFLWDDFYAHCSALGATDTTAEDLEALAETVSSMLGRVVRAPMVGS